ncbi:MAG TPA: hypothetical protein VF789_21530 [Thermoanaerobaculia bacterium]
MDFSRFKEDDGTFLTGRSHAQAVRTALILVLLGGAFLAVARFLQWPAGSEIRSLMSGIAEILGWAFLGFSTAILFVEWRFNRAKEQPFVVPGASSMNAAGNSGREQAIDKLYSELRPLLSRAAADPNLREEAQRKLSLLRKLQDEEADEIQKRFEAGLLFKPGEGRRALERAREVLARYEDPSSPHAATRQKN